MLEGALVLLVGILVGRFLPGRRRAPKPPAPVRPICGCGHNRSFHQDGARCQERVYLPGVGHRQCTCAAYVGPEPLPEYIAPEISA